MTPVENKIAKVARELDDLDRQFKYLRERAYTIDTTGASPIFTGLTLSGLTASLALVTDANKKLASLAYTGATSLRKNLGLETSDSPIFAGLTVNGQIVTNRSGNQSINTGDGISFNRFIAGQRSSVGTDLNATFYVYDTDNSAYRMAVKSNGNTIVNGTSDDGVSKFQVNGDIVSVKWTDYSSTSTVTGVTTPTKQIYYKKIGKTVICSYVISGAGTGTAVSFTLPYSNQNPNAIYSSVGVLRNNAVDEAGGYCAMNSGSSTVELYRLAAVGWSGTGTRVIIGQFFYEST